MKVSLPWLQTYFEETLPPVEEVAHTLTFHSCEIEEQVGDMLDVKVLPDRASYALSHRGIALEISAALDIPMKLDPLRTVVAEFPSTDTLTVEVSPEYVLRHMGALVRGVTVGPSPEWLRTALESVGQRSINNIVDATNYVMLNIGQPMHAFDAAKISRNGDVLRITIRPATDGEKVTVLTGEEYTLDSTMYVIADATSGEALDIAGLKGGAASGITEATTELFVSVGTYDSSCIRKTSQTLKLWTDASQRYQNKISPELGAYGMRDILALITDIAGGEVVGVVDVWPSNGMVHLSPVSVTLEKIQRVLGIAVQADEVASALGRIQLPFVEQNNTFIVTPPFERRDICIEEDVIEEVGRILGYERITPTPLPPLNIAPDQHAYRGIEFIKDFLVERGFIELSTQSFAKEGEICLSNPLQQDRPWLRASLMQNMSDALAHTVTIAPRVLGPETLVKLFEIGSVFSSAEESLSLALGVRTLSGKKALAADALKEHIATLEQEVFRSHIRVKYSLDGETAEISLAPLDLTTLSNEIPQSVRLGAYTPFSIYPAALRDIAVWVPEGTVQSEVSVRILACAGEYLARIDLFDRFEKEGRISYAFRLVFEAMDRTLSDKDLDPAMEAVTLGLRSVPGFEVR